MNAKSLSSILSLLILLGSAAFASAQNNLLFTFDESGPNVTATVTGSFDTSGLSPAGQTTPIDPATFPAAASTVFSFGTTNAANIDQFGGANAPGGPAIFFPFLAAFPIGDFDSIVTPLSEYLEINVQLFNDPDFPGNATIGLAEGETVFDGDALTNNVIVFSQSSLDDLGDSSFLSTTPFTVLSDLGGGNNIQFVLAVPEPSSTALLFACSTGMALLRRRR